MVRYICEGRHGAGLVMADIGRREKLSAAKINNKGTFIPSEYFPLHSKEAQSQQERMRYKPDALIEVKGKVGEKSTLHIVEFKYCRDTDRSSQETRAEQQHGRLKELLRWKYNVKRQNIYLGVFGTVYRDAGVEPTRAKKALKEAHIHTVKQLPK